MASYNPAVLNRSGEIRAAGLQAGMNAFTSLLGQGLGMMQQRRENQADRNWQKERFGMEQAADERRWQMQDARDERRFQQQMSLAEQEQNERKLAAAMKKQEEADAADGMLAGVFSLYGPNLPPHVMEAATRMKSPKAKEDFAKTLAGYAAETIRNTTPTSIETPEIPGTQYVAAIINGKPMGTLPKTGANQKPPQPQAYQPGQPIQQPDGSWTFAPYPPNPPTKPTQAARFGDDPDGNPIIGYPRVGPDGLPIGIQQVPILPPGQPAQPTPPAVVPRSAGAYFGE